MFRGTRASLSYVTVNPNLTIHRPMKISVIGSGYVGTTVAACLADAGHEVINIDIDESIVDSINNGVAPIHEEGLDELVAEHGGNHLKATTDYDAVTDTELTFVCLPTPSREDGSVDLTAFEAGVSSLGDALADKDEHTVVVKSTVPPGTAESVVVPAVGSHVHVVSNPEFLREGTAVNDLRNPDKVVVGSESQEARTKVLKAYEGVHQNEPAVVETGNTEAELVKYANNSFLAAKVSLVNELGNISKELNVDAYEVLEAVGLDDRISSRFLRSGLGWGGSCLVGDERVLVKEGVEEENGRLWHTTLAEFYEYAEEGSLDGVSVLSLRDDGTYGFEPVVAVTRREYDGELHTVRTRMNKTVTVTHDHPMLTVEDSGVAVREARELDECDRLPVLNEMSENPVGSSDLTEIVGEPAVADGGTEREHTTVEVRGVTVENTTTSTEVYSLEVENSHTFVTTDGIAVHNCFPKDIDALRAVARDEGYDSPLLDAAIEVNDLQPKRAVELLERHIDPDGARVAVLGLAFKPGTDDVRNSRAIDLAEILVERGANVVAYDPEAAENARAELPEVVEIAPTAEDALEGADAAVVTTAWEEFENVSLDGMKEKVVIDGRRMNLQEEADVYEGLCW